MRTHASTWVSCDVGWAAKPSTMLDENAGLGSPAYEKHSLRRARWRQPRSAAAAWASAPIVRQSFAFNASPGTIHDPPTVITFGSAR